MKTLLKRHTGITAIAALSFVLMGSPLLFAQDQDKMQDKMHKEGVARFDATIRELNLTPQQQERIAGQREQAKAQAMEIRKQERLKRQELKAELEKDTVDRQKIDALILDMEHLMGQRIKMRVDGILEMKTILTPEQYKALNQKLGKERDRKGRVENRASYGRIP